MTDNAFYPSGFSKVVAPGLRVGYMVLPRALAAPFRTAHADLYREGHAITQAALAELIEQGHYAAHIRRMRVLYARRRALLVALIVQHLGSDYLDAQSSNAGLHLVLRLPDECDDVAIADEARARGVLTRPLSRYYLRGSGRRGKLLEKAGAVRDGGSFAERMGAVACWNSVMTEDRFLVQKWNEFVAA